MRRILAQTRKELTQIVRDWRTLALALILPLALLLLTSTAHVNRLIGTRDNLIRDLGCAREQEALGKAAFKTTLHSIGDAVIATDSAGRIQFMNRVAETLTGWTAAAGAGRPLPEVFHIINQSTRLPVENPADKILRDGVAAGLANRSLHPIIDTQLPLAAAPQSHRDVMQSGSAGKIILIP